MSGARYADSIDLWQVRIEARGRHETDAALGMLSAAERERAARFVAAGARAKFLVGRAALRVVLAAYLNGDPSQLRLAEDPRGKPRLWVKSSPGLHFDLSHSDALVMIAVTGSGPVGIDLERVRNVPDALAIAGRFFPTSSSLGYRCGNSLDAVLPDSA